MPLIKRRPFEPKSPPKDLNDDEQVYYFKLTNELFRDYDDYFARVILCNSMVWSCSLTGKANLTFHEAVDSEKAARKLLKGFPRPVKKALLHLSTLTARGKLNDVVDDVLVYARDRYFRGEEVLAVIGNLWCKSRVINVIEPSSKEIEAYKLDQIEKGEADNNDYLKDDSWGPAPDLFRYEVEEIDPDEPDVVEALVLEAIDVKREKASLTRDKCKFLLKLAMDYDEDERKFIVKEGIISSNGLSKVKFEDIFVGSPPNFEVSLGPVKSGRASTTPKSASSRKPSKSSTGNSKDEKSNSKSKGKSTDKKTVKKSDGTTKKATKSDPKPKKVEVKLTPQELKQIEQERKAKERENLKAQRKLIADFKKLWFKPKEDLEVEDLKDLPEPDPVVCKIPNNLFGDFMMVMEFMSSYSSFVKVRDCFSSGLTIDILERALTKSEIAGPFSDILQLLLRAVFRLQEGERAVIAKEEAATVELEVNEVGDDVTVTEAIQQATSAATWSHMYQNTPLHKLGVDYATLTEVLRLHLLASGARQSQQSRGSCAENDDPGLYFRIDEPQILKTLSTGSVFDLTMTEKLKVLQCLIHQILSYSAVKDIMDESFEQFKQARINYKTVVAAERRKETEDHLWRQKLKADKVIPDMNALKVAAERASDSGEEGLVVDGKVVGEKKVKAKETTSDKPQLTDEQIEAAILKKDKEIARRKQDFLWKEAELLDQINKHEKKLGAHPLGRDRAYRRYWVFPTLPGLFVEHDDEFIGECLPTPTPYIGEVNLEDVNFIKENFNKLKQSDREGSDKENSTTLSPKKNSKKKTPVAVPLKKEIARPLIFGICSGNSTSCPVHSTSISRPKWSFFWDPEHIDGLIAGLTLRGIREKELKQNLVEAKDNLKNLIKKCPVMKLNQEKKYPESITSAPERRPPRTLAKNQSDPNLGFPSDTLVETILELHLRDLILETEEKIFLGGLGSLKVEDRAQWRIAMESRSFNAGTSSLTWGGGKTMQVSNSSTNYGENNEKEEVSNQVVRDLACAILQLQQGVEFKYMNRPLVEKEEDKKKKSKSSETESVWKSIWSSGPPLERWQLSLMASTSFSQLFVHFCTLESSVEWSRSVLNARCRICRRKGDPEKMLLCDTCNKGHHAYCLKPALENLPKGDWFCADCRPPEPLPTPSKKRILSDDDILDELESDDDEEEEREVVRRGSKKMSSLQQDEDLEVCAECGFGGEVICCDRCPLVYHLLCLNPPKSRVPRGTWYCPECTNPKKRKVQKGKKKPSPKSKKKPTKRKLHYSSSEESDEKSEEEEEEEMIDSFIESDNDDEEEEAADEKEESEDDAVENAETDDNEETHEIVRVKFGKSSKKRSPDFASSSSGHGTRSARRIVESDSDDDEHVGREGKRKSASMAAVKIAQAVKRLRSDSKENNETSESSNDSNYNSRKRSLDSNEQMTGDCPKRTRLQRMNTNNRIENGELDNVLLDKLISDVMKQSDAWPFLKPVTRAEAPDYHEIVKYPMDLGTIKYKLNSMVYTCNEELVSDLLLIFTNCFVYNEHTHPIYQTGLKLKLYCEKRCEKLGINFSDPVPS